MQSRLKRSYRIASVIGRHERFVGSIPLVEMPRLLTLLQDGSGQVEAEFEFDRNELGLSLIRGSLSTRLAVTCERCLEPMELAVERPFELLIDAPDEDAVAFQRDTVETSDGFLDVFDVIEDEVMLSLPIIIKHDDANCNEHWPKQTGVNDDASVETQNHPFAALAALKETD